MIERGGVVVKVCGLRRREDVVAALEAGADLHGFVFAERSPRRASVDELSPYFDALFGERGERFRPVGVFVSAPIAEIVETARLLHLFAVQLHGRETPGDAEALRAEGIRVIRAARAKNAESLEEDLAPFLPLADAILVDAYVPGQEGGTGARFDPSLATPWIARHRTVVAGGLTPANVGRLIRAVRPWGVDVSSGVELSPGLKDHDAIRRFVAAARGALDSPSDPS